MEKQVSSGAGSVGAIVDPGRTKQEKTAEAKPEWQLLLS